MVSNAESPGRCLSREGFSGVEGGERCLPAGILRLALGGPFGRWITCTLPSLQKPHRPHRFGPAKKGRTPLPPPRHSGTWGSHPGVLGTEWGTLEKRGSSLGAARVFVPRGVRCSKATAAEPVPRALIHRQTPEGSPDKAGEGRSRPERTAISMSPSHEHLEASGYPPSFSCSLHSRKGLNRGRDICPP